MSSLVGSSTGGGSGAGRYAIAVGRWFEGSTRASTEPVDSVPLLVPESVMPVLMMLMDSSGCFLVRAEVLRRR